MGDMKTIKRIRPELLSHFLTRYYQYMIAGWLIHIHEDGSWEGEYE